MSIWPLWTSSATIQLYLTHFLSLSTFILNPSGTQVMLLGFWRSNSTLIWPMWTNCAARKSQLEPASPTLDKKSTSASGRSCHKTLPSKKLKKNFCYHAYFKIYMLLVDNPYWHIRKKNLDQIEAMLESLFVIVNTHSKFHADRS